MSQVRPISEEVVLRTMEQLDHDLPTIPQVLSQVLYLTSSDKSSCQDLTRVLNQDQALTARILRVANSAFYGLRQKVSTVDRAVVVLGFDLVRSLATSASFINWFSHLEKHPGFPLNKFWVHATAVGVFAEILARRTGAADPADAFTTGILHDIGKLVLLVYHGAEFNRVQKRIEAEQISFYEAEIRELGITHGLVAGLFLSRQNLPENLVSVVSHHHEPLAAGKEARFAACVHLADFAACFLKIGESGSPYLAPLSKKVLRLLGLTPEAFKELLEEMSTRQDQIWNLLKALG
ncbi:MAG: HDOD domain-containing protein [Thermodesulfobacteriota bacterium]